MKEANENEENTSPAATDGAARKFEISGAQDLPDSPGDQEEMKTEEIMIDLPDVKDIPGQEHVRPPALGMLADTTASSDDEEGAGIFGDEEDSEDDAELIMGTEADVSDEEKADLEQADEDIPTSDDNNLKSAALDNTDEEGESLNEKGFGDDVSGNDIDVPGAEIDDLNEDIGEEDEENNPYSLGGDKDNNESNQ